MAMTQTAVEYTGPSWDETIVPTLRKRLQTESRALSKRMSTISVTSSHEGTDHDSISHQQPPKSSQRHHHHSQQHHHHPQQRQQQQQQQQPQPQPSQTRSSSDRAPRPTRSRTYSQPPAFGGADSTKRPAPNGTSPASSTTKPTRIPKPTTRSPPIHQNGRVKDTESLTPSLLNDSGSSIRVPSRQASGILQEPAPFDSTSNHDHGTQFEDAMYYDAPTHDVHPIYGEVPRMSMDSTEERPFEHWYRGESSRNGGVGELRIGSRQEMLDIANYGHEMRARKRAMAAARKLQHEAEPSDNMMRRKRADSVVGLEGKRDSLYLDEADEMAVDDTAVDDMYVDASSHTQRPSNSRSVTPTPSLIPRPSSRQQQNTTPSKPSPRTRQNSNAPPIQRGVSEPPLSMNKRGPSPSTPDKRSRTVGGKMAAAASPGNSSMASADSRKLNATATNRAKRERERKQKEKESRRSVAQYPAVDGEDMVDAIPMWTEPVKSGQGGNWDDVVLPAIARKRGLDGYEITDGSPKPNQHEERIEPAPGTFGYDHTKYRPPRLNFGEGKENLAPMDEFGTLPNNILSTGGTGSNKQSGENTPSSRRGGNGPPSPAPFSHYQSPSMPDDMKAAGILQKQQEGAMKNKLEQMIPEEDEEAKKGCCSCCVVM